MALAGRGRDRRWFAERPLGLACWNLFDLGVVDRRRRGHLDVFTVNHNSRQSLLENDGSGRFRDVLSELRLDQDRVFPGWADDVSAPPLVEPGLYLYREGNSLIVRSVGGAGHEWISGTLSLDCPVRDLAPSEIDTVVDRAGGGSTSTVVRFRARGPGRLELRPELVGLPVTVRLDGEVALGRVYVGPTMATPPAPEFVLRLRDRHGMAWAAIGDAGRLDVFVARGGLRGRLEHYGGVVRDELFVDTGAGYEDHAARLGIGKGVCRSRQAGWVPLPGAHGLHLFVSCHGAAPQLHRRGPDGRFVDVAVDLGLGDVRGDHFAWVDVDGDGWPELLAVDGARLLVHRFDGGRFGVHQSVPLRGDRVRKLAVGDYDGDGDADLFAPSPGGNTLLVNDGGTYRPVDPRTVGLPGAGGVTASWVDFDNDGLDDLHLVPGGLFRRRGDGTFAATRLLEHRLPATVADARVTWFDSDGTGSRDVVVAVVATSKADGAGFDWVGRLFANVGAAGHWLQVDLEGPPDNPHGLGAAVRVATAGRTWTRCVGWSEGSHFSQGHYRVYFGLGRAPLADSVTVTWPDGTVDTLGRPAGDERVTIAHTGSGDRPA